MKTGDRSPATRARRACRPAIGSQHSAESTPPPRSAAQLGRSGSVVAGRSSFDRSTGPYLPLQSCLCLLPSKLALRLRRLAWRKVASNRHFHNIFRDLPALGRLLCNFYTPRPLALPCDSDRHDRPPGPRTERLQPDLPLPKLVRSMVDGGGWRGWPGVTNSTCRQTPHGNAPFRKLSLHIQRTRYRCSSRVTTNVASTKLRP